MSSSLTRANAATMMQRMIMMTLCGGRRGREEGEGRRGKGGREEEEGEGREGGGGGGREGGRGRRGREEGEGGGGRGREGCNIQGNVTDG